MSFFRKKVEDLLSRLENVNPKYRKEYLQKIRKKSILTDSEKFPSSMVKGRFKYNYTLFKALIDGGIRHYKKTKFSIKARYKMMEFLYITEGFYTIKYKNTIFKIKKNPNLFDIYYYDDKIYVSILKKIKFNFVFKYSELEKFHEDA